MGIVAATRGKHVQHFGVFQSGRLVFDIPFHDDAVTAAQVIGLAAAYELDAPADNIDKLLMGMLVAYSNPSFR